MDQQGPETRSSPWIFPDCDTRGNNPTTEKVPRSATGERNVKRHWLTFTIVGIDQLHLDGVAAAPRCKPNNKPRSAEDVAYNQAFSRRRIIVEQTIGRLRRYQAITQTDRHHRQHHTHGG